MIVLGKVIIVLLVASFIVYIVAVIGAVISAAISAAIREHSLERRRKEQEVFCHFYDEIEIPSSLGRKSPKMVYYKLLKNKWDPEHNIENCWGNMGLCGYRKSWSSTLHSILKHQRISRETLGEALDFEIRLLKKKKRPNTAIVSRLYAYYTDGKALSDGVDTNSEELEIICARYLTDFLVMKVTLHEEVDDSVLELRSRLCSNLREEVETGVETLNDLREELKTKRSERIKSLIKLD